MIGIPYNPIITGEYEPDTILVFIVNAKSAHSKRALEYAKHFVKSYEWVYNVIETGWSDPDIEKSMASTPFAFTKTRWIGNFSRPSGLAQSALYGASWFILPLMIPNVPTA